MKIMIPFLVLSITSCQQIPKEQNHLEKKLFRAMDLHDTERYLQAIEVYDSIIVLDPTYDRAYHGRAMSYYSLDSNELAIKDFEKVESIDPRFPGLRDWHARALAAENRYLEAAVLKLKELRDYQVDDLGMGISPADWSEGAEYYREAGFPDSAIAVLDEYFKWYENKVTTYKDHKSLPISLYAMILLEKNDVQGAFNKIKGAMGEDKIPANYPLWIQLNIQMGDTVTAREYLNYYITEVHDGFETDEAKALQIMIQPLAKN